MSLTSAPGCGNGASAKLSPVARPPTKLTPVITPLRAEGSFIGDPFVTANPPFWSQIQYGKVSWHHAELRSKLYPSLHRRKRTPQQLGSPRAAAD
jgi:hypothetical protein